jgi:hypothetical protein
VNRTHRRASLQIRVFVGTPNGVSDLFKYPHIRKEGVISLEVQMLKKIIFGILRFMFYLIMTFVILFLMWILYWTVAYNQFHKEIQQALDRTCGVKVVLESEGTFYDDPFYSWRNSHRARCIRDSNEWECICGDTSP